MMQLSKVITAPEQLGREQNSPWPLYKKNSKLPYLLLIKNRVRKAYEAYVLATWLLLLRVAPYKLKLLLPAGYNTLLPSTH